MHPYIKKFQVLIAGSPVSVTQKNPLRLANLQELWFWPNYLSQLCYAMESCFPMVITSDQFQEVTCSHTCTKNWQWPCFWLKNNILLLTLPFTLSRHYILKYLNLWLKFRVWPFLPNSPYSMTILRSHGFTASSFLHCFVFNEIIRNWV